MQFSTSAAVATIVLFAGQTLAACTPGLPGNAENPQKCEIGNDHTWTCKDGTWIHRAGDNKYNIQAGDRPYVGLVASCTSQRSSEAKVHCTADSRGSFHLDCAGEVEIFKYWLVY
ncbi:hypothetical protein E4U42_002553 [Claviceps africana]|uniref:Uncharacterized protein n=1 Tax=Claviceps africana TaxID=83212 RepID=A0A8K0J9A4_9HYPO|nr:hypothetical protein E4U42_002553 [Claviceps africana]